MRPLVPILLIAAAAPLAVAAGCGTDKLDTGDANSLQADKKTIDDDVQAIQAIDGDRAEARRLVNSITRTLVIYERFQKAAQGAGGAIGSSLQQGAGEQALSLIAKDVPSIVIGGSSSSPTGLDTAATKAYIRYAASDPRRALRGPVTDHVRSMLIDVQDASPDTKVPTLHDQTVKQVLDAAAGELQPYWPDQAARLGAKANGKGG
jgi:hypothetical protein